MNSSEKIMEAVAAAKAKYDVALRSYEAKAEDVENMSKRSINIGSGADMSRGVDIIATAVKACDELYATCQGLIVVLDETCRPLLDETTSTKAVVSVAGVIGWLNSESEIKNNYFASLNNSATQQVGTRQYIPSVENKVRQAYWEGKANVMPDAEVEWTAFRKQLLAENDAKRKAKVDEQRELREFLRKEKEDKRKAEKERLKRVTENVGAADDIREYWRPARQMLVVSDNAMGAVFPDGHVEVYYNISSNSSTGKNPDEVKTFTNVKQLVATQDGFVALMKDGTCRATNPGKDSPSRILQANNWTNIVALAAAKYHVVGLRADGTCISHDLRQVFENKGQCNVYGWTSVKEIVCGDTWTVGIKEDGNILFAGDESLSEVRQWKNIISVAGHFAGIVGITKECTVLSVGSIVTSSIKNAENVVQLANSHFSYALESNGDLVGGVHNSEDIHPVITKSILAVAGCHSRLMVINNLGYVKSIKGNNIHGFPYSGIRIFPDGYDVFAKQLEEEALEKQKKQQQQEEWKRQGLCQYCGGSFIRKFFSQKCSSCGKSKDY